MLSPEGGGGVSGQSGNRHREKDRDGGGRDDDAICRVSSTECVFSLEGRCTLTGKALAILFEKIIVAENLLTAILNVVIFY